MVERRKRIEPKLPAPVGPVMGGITWTNAAWVPWLTKPVTRNGWPSHDGRDPRLIKPEVLTASGHPPRSATTCIRAYLSDLDLARDPERDRGLPRVRELCLKCTSGVFNEITRCAIINCPLWAHRMGKNPHNR